MTDTDGQYSLPPKALAKILDVTQKLAAPFDLISMLTEVVEAGKEVLGADRGTLWLYDEDQDELIMQVPKWDPPVRRESGIGIVGQCELKREIINVPDCNEDPRFIDVIGQETGYRTRCALNVPLIGYDNSMVGVMQLLNKHDGVFDENDEMIAASLAAQCAVALQRTRMNESLMNKERLDEEVTVAREIQMSTLPTVMPDVPGYDVYGTFLPTDQTGGDTFDLVMLDDELFMLMGDATGHGFGPALSATQMQAMLRVAFRCGVDLDAAFCHVNNQMAEDLPDDRFVTAFMGFLNPEKHKIRFHSGGQGPILHFHAASGECEWHKPTSFPLGVLEIKEPGEGRMLDMQPGDILGLISDGVYEYENSSGEQFGEAGVAAIVSDYHDLSMSELADRLLIATFGHGGDVPQADDITVALVRRSSA